MREGIFACVQMKPSIRASCMPCNDGSARPSCINTWLLSLITLQASKADALVMYASSLVSARPGVTSAFFSVLFDVSFLPSETHLRKISSRALLSLRISQWTSSDGITLSMKAGRTVGDGIGGAFDLV